VLSHPPLPGKSDCIRPGRPSIKTRGPKPNLKYRQPGKNHEPPSQTTNPIRPSNSMNILIIITGTPQSYWNQQACLRDPELAAHLYNAKSTDKAALVRTTKTVYLFQNSPKEMPHALFSATTTLAQMATRKEIPDNANIVFPTPSNYGTPAVSDEILRGIRATIQGTALLPLPLPPPPPDASRDRPSRKQTAMALAEMAEATDTAG
jgi:hypothetical protein